MSSKSSALISLTLMIFFCSGCIESKSDLPHWQSQDVRSIDPVDAADPTNDLIAIETQSAKPFLFTPDQSLFIRLDFLDHSLASPQVILILFDTASGGNNQHPFLGKTKLAWEFYLLIRPNQVNIYDQQNQPLSSINVSVFQQTDQDYLEIAIRSPSRKYFLSTNVIFQVFILSNSDKHVLDSSEPVKFSALAPQPLNLFFVFWNSFPARTPAQALRNWDGAHSGPLGARHGLYNLSRAAQSQNIPIVLLDLKTPESLSALDYAGKLNYLNPLFARQQFIAPDNFPFNYSIPDQNGLDLPSHYFAEVSHSFGIGKSPFLFMPELQAINPNELPLDHSVLFTLSNYSEITVSTGHFGNVLWIVIPKLITDSVFQPDEHGLSIALKKELIKAILNQKDGQSKVIAIGGNLPHSPWGDYQIAQAGFEMLKRVPWIHIMNYEDLITLGNNSDSISNHLSTSSRKNQFDSTNLPPLNNLHLTLERDLFLNLLSPIDNAGNFTQLRNNYAPILPAYQFVDSWYYQTKTIAECPQDITGDQKKDCILANESLFLWIDPSNGSLLFIFEKANEQIHQIVAPSFILIGGQTDPMQWDYSKGIYAENRPDTAALTDYINYSTYQIEAGKLYLFSRDFNPSDPSSHDPEKLIHLEDHHISVIYPNSFNSPIFLPLILDPWNRFETDWSNYYHLCPNDYFPKDDQSICWSYQAKSHQSDLFVNTIINSLGETQENSTINIQSEFYTFRDTQSRFSHTEDPNQDRPPGHFIPFPMGILQINPPLNSPLSITISVSN